MNLVQPPTPRSTIVYREGEPAPVGNVYATFELARQAALLGAPAFLLIDPSLGTPQILTSGDLTNVALVAGPQSAYVNVANGVVLTGLSRLDAVGLISLSSTPIFVAPAGIWGFVMENGSSIITGSTGSPISVPSGAQFYTTMRDGSFLLPNGAVRALTTSGTGAGSMDVGRSCSVQANTITGPNYTVIVDDDVVNGSFSLTQTGATYTLVRQYEVGKYVFSATTLVSVAAAASTLPPGYGVATIAQVILGHLVGAAGVIKQMNVSFVGNASNAAQTLAVALKRTTSAGVTTTLVTATVAANAGTHGASVTFSPTLVIAGEILSVDVTPSAILTANVTNIMAVAA